MGTVVMLWALGCLGVAAVLAVAAPRIGPARAASGLVLLGVLLVTLEEPALTLWLALAPPGDPDRIGSLATPLARAHLIDAAVYALAAAGLLGWVALTAFGRGERWAQRVLRYAWIVVAATEAATVVFVHSRGLPLPGPGGAAGASGIGWPPLAVGLLAWAGGLWLIRHRAARPVATPARAGGVGGVAG